VSSTFNALVRFDIQAREVAVTIGGSIGSEAVEEVCQVIERSVSISGRPAEVDLSDTDVTTETLDRIQARCGGIADITGPDGSG
jgi:hypothetical protein